MILLPIMFLFSRVFATVYILFTKPLKSIGRIPKNWQRIVLSTDLFLFPEIVPGIERLKSKTMAVYSIEFFTMSEFIPSIYKAAFNEITLLNIVFSRYSVKLWVYLLS